MNIFPAIDLYQGNAVRLYKGDYAQMQIYSTNPLEVALDFQRSGAKFLHMVDLEGAKTGTTPNISVIRKIAAETELFIQVGGGVRNMQVVDTYLSCGVDRVIIGTAAVNDPDFLTNAIDKYGNRIAVGIDLKDGFVAIHGWTETSALTADCFFQKMEAMGVQSVICTDISKDGAMQGTNRKLYADLSQKYNMDLIASGGVSDLEDIKALRKLDLYGAIIGKAYYTGAIDLKEALEAAK